MNIYRLLFSTNVFLFSTIAVTVRGLLNLYLTSYGCPFTHSTSLI